MQKSTISNVKLKTDKEFERVYRPFIAQLTEEDDERARRQLIQRYQTTPEALFDPDMFDHELEQETDYFICLYHKCGEPHIREAVLNKVAPFKEHDERASVTCKKCGGLVMSADGIRRRTGINRAIPTEKPSYVEYRERGRYDGRIALVIHVASDSSSDLNETSLVVPGEKVRFLGAEYDTELRKEARKKAIASGHIKEGEQPFAQPQPLYYMVERLTDGKICRLAFDTTQLLML